MELAQMSLKVELIITSDTRLSAASNSAACACAGSGYSALDLVWTGAAVLLLADMHQFKPRV